MRKLVFIFLFIFPLLSYSQLKSVSISPCGMEIVKLPATYYKSDFMKIEQDKKTISVIEFYRLKGDTYFTYFKSTDGVKRDIQYYGKVSIVGNDLVLDFINVDVPVSFKFSFCTRDGVFYICDAEDTFSLVSKGFWQRR